VTRNKKPKKRDKPWERAQSAPFARLSAVRHVDYGYTATSFSSQGSMVDRVIANDNSMRSARRTARADAGRVVPARAIISVFGFDLGSFPLELTRQPITPGSPPTIIAGSASSRKFWEVL
jgi:hypothetical protein